MLLAITSGGKLGLGVLAGAFIVFALLSAFYFPRRNPDFPGRRLGLYIVVAALEQGFSENTDRATVEAFEQAIPPDQAYQGLARYWRKRAE